MDMITTYAKAKMTEHELVQLYFWVSRLVELFVSFRSHNPDDDESVEEVSLPELSQLNPNMSQLNPELSQLNPNLSQLNPNLSQLNPNLSQLNPELSQLNPELSQLNPDV